MSPRHPTGAGAGRDEHEDLLALVDHLGTLLERSDLAELEVEAGATSILLRRAETTPVQPDDPAATAPHPDPAAGAAVPAVATGEGPTVRAVLAPLTGIFYAAPTPDSPPFVSAGVEIVVGQVIGLIEAMKLFNEIKSDVAGRVLRVVAESGQLVKAREPLVEVAGFG